MNRTVRKLFDLLKSSGYQIPGTADDWKIRRTYAGRHQRSVGAWSWYLEWVGDIKHGSWSGAIGGYWPAKQCAKNGASVTTEFNGSISIDPPGY